jgi:alpha-1,2-mannosyltransferase
MAGFLETLRSGDWLTLERMRLWALAVLAASAGGLLYLVATSDGLIDYQGRPLGTDFSNVYAAGSYVLEGQPAAPFDPRLQHAREQVIFGTNTPFYGWHYPPFFLAVAAALALLPYQLALIVWQGATLLLYLIATRAIVSPLIPPPQGEGKRPSAIVRTEIR